MPTTLPIAEQHFIRRLTRLVWAIVAVLAALLYVSYTAAGLTLEVWSNITLLLMAPGSAALGLFYRTIRSDPWISFGAEATAQFLAILLICTLISFAIATTAFPYRDAELYALDRAMGFDWLAYLNLANTHPWLGTISTLSYGSMIPQTAFTIGLLIISTNFVRLQLFSIATALSLFVTLAIFAFVPAVAYYAYLDVSPSEFANLTPVMSYQHIRHLEGLRSGATRVVQLGDLEGLITFPSFHAASALLFAWAAWPFRRLRWWIAGLNVLLVASTPIDGAHYVIDLVAGIAIAGLSIVATQKLCALLKRDYPPAFVQQTPEPMTQPRALMGYSDYPAFSDSAKAPGTEA